MASTDDIYRAIGVLEGKVDTVIDRVGSIKTHCANVSGKLDTRVKSLEESRVEARAFSLGWGWMLGKGTEIVAITAAVLGAARAAKYLGWF